MRVSKSQIEKNRGDVFAAAKRLCLERGVAGCGVSDVMGAAGLTHGGFYRHFASKDDLMTQACASIFDEKSALWSVELEGGQVLDRVTRRYLRMHHRDRWDTGCPMPALAVDAARAGGPFRRAFTQGVERLFDLLAAKLGGAANSAARQKALSTWATLVGALTLARAVDDRALALEILEAASATLGGRRQRQKSRKGYPRRSSP